MCGLPNMSVVVPCDAIETRKATRHLLLEHVGPKYLRFAREATPVVTTDETPFVFGKANVIRLRHTATKFVNAFQTVLAGEYANEDEDLTIIACGPMVPEAMRAAFILHEEFGWETRILNMHTLKPLDREAVLRAAKETAFLVTAEEHQIGALAGAVSNIITSAPELYRKHIITGAVGVADRFGESGAPWELIQKFEVSAEHIVRKVVQLAQIWQPAGIQELERLEARTANGEAGNGRPSMVRKNAICMISCELESVCEWRDTPACPRRRHVCPVQ
jgi:transketolase